MCAPSSRPHEFETVSQHRHYDEGVQIGRSQPSCITAPANATIPSTPRPSHVDRSPPGEQRVALSTPFSRGLARATADCRALQVLKTLVVLLNSGPALEGL